MLVFAKYGCNHRKFEQQQLLMSRRNILTLQQNYVQTYNAIISKNIIKTLSFSSRKISRRIMRGSLMLHWNNEQLGWSTKTSIGTYWGNKLQEWISQYDNKQMMFCSDMSVMYPTVWQSSKVLVQFDQSHICSYFPQK